MIKKRYKLKSTIRGVKEFAWDLLRLLEYIGTDEKCEVIKVYVYRLEKIVDVKK